MYLCYCTCALFPRSSVLQAQCPHMVQLLHYYEVSNQRIFLLLEHVRGGRLLDFVQAKREQWQRLKEAVENPQSSNLLVSRLKSMDAHEQSASNNKAKAWTTAPDRSLKGVARGGDLLASESPLSESPGEESADQEMERMLSELTSIVPPSNVPLTGSLVSEGSGSDATDSMDSLALMRRRLEETMEASDEFKSRVEERDGLDRGYPVADGSEAPRDSSLQEESSGSEGATVQGAGGESIGSRTAINIQPPTPTVPPEGVLGSQGNSGAHRTSLQVSTPSSVRAVEESSSRVRGTESAATVSVR